MGYIVDLTLILRRLFWQIRARGGIQPLPKDMLFTAANDFLESPDKEQLHTEIRSFVKRMGVFEIAQKDLVLGEVVRLIQKYRFDPSDDDAVIDIKSQDSKG